MADQFDANFIKKVEEEIRKKVIDRLDKIAIQAHNRVSTATPKDLGQAQAGWNFTLNKIDTTKPERPKRSKKGEIQKELQKKPSVPDKKARNLGDEYYLSNAVEHLKYLNDGTSKQAPTNFIEKEVSQAVRDVES